MRPVALVFAAAALAGTVGACAGPYYPTRTYAYSSDYYYPNYYSSRPVYYSTAPAPVYYPSRPYYGYRYGGWDYYRNYNGIHSSAEVSAM
jgi:hypothetical protein